MTSHGQCPRGGGGACECPRVGAFFKLMTSRGQCPRGGGGAPGVPPIQVQTPPHLALAGYGPVMVQYPRAIREIGPLIRVWAMRFEGRHNNFKKLARIVDNFKNIAKTLAERNQASLCHSLSSGDVLNLVTQVGPGSSQPIITLERSEEIADTLGCSRYDEVFCTTWVDVDGTKYKVGMTVLLEYNEDGATFGVIQHMFIDRDMNVDLSVVVVDDDHYDRHYHAHAVPYDHDGPLKLVPVRTLRDHHPLHAASGSWNNPFKYVALRHRLI